MLHDPNRRPTSGASRRLRRRLAIARLRARRHTPLRRRRRLVVWLAVLALLSVALVAVGGQVAFALITSDVGPLPQPRQLGANSIVTDAAGNVIAELHPNGETRLPVPLDQIATVEQQAIVDVEDRAFWSEGPIDVGRMIASAWHNLNHDGAEQGASTIPMQLAKVLYLTDDQSFAYKLRQIGFAGNLVSSLSKHDILEAYLNDIFFGEGATGIEAASRVYFGIPSAKLDLAQAAMLAGLPNAPSVDDPILHPQAAAQREQTVLDAMVATGDVTASQEQQALAEQLTFASASMDDLDSEPAFVARVAQQVGSQLHLDPLRAGLRITTTLDPGLQQYAQQTVHTQVEAVRSLNVSDGALVSVVPQTGAVVAYVGSAAVDPASAQIDMAAKDRQPGSTFKLFTYSTALTDRRVTMVTPVLDAPLTLPTGGGADGMLPWSPLDYDRTWHGVLPVAKAFANSLNIPAIRTELATGVPSILSTARNLGVTTLAKPDSFYGPSMTLGAYGVPLWEMAQAMTTFADQGQLHPVTFISSVRDQDGRELYSGPAPRQVMDPGAVHIVNQILTNDSNRQLEFGLNSDLTLPGHLVSAKTGTSEDFKDNLTIGWTPQLATAVWVGNADDAPMHGTTGVTGAAPIWHSFMLHALVGVPDGWPAAPADVFSQDVPGFGTAWFLDGTTPQTGAGLLGAHVAAPRGDAAAAAASVGAQAGDSGPTSAPTPASGRPHHH